MLKVKVQWLHRDGDQIKVSPFTMPYKAAQRMMESGNRKTQSCLSGSQAGVQEELT